MSTGSKIEWCKHTFNPWWGCTKVHDGCKHCYAESWDGRWGGDHWGPRAARRMILGEWSKPAKWNREAQAAGVVDRVFCASMCDLFEDFDGPVVDQRGEPVMCPPLGKPWTVPMLRHRTLDMVRETPWLDWLLLTKRPENVVRMVPEDWHGDWPTNVMVGTSPCDQKTADASIPALLVVPGRRFLSCEPLLGPVDLLWSLNGHACQECADWNEIGGVPCEHNENYEWRAHALTIAEAEARPTGAGPIVPGSALVHWVIVGGESGSGARPCDVGWIRSIVAQCRAAQVPCFVKQLGRYPIDERVLAPSVSTDPKTGVTVAIAGGRCKWDLGLRDRKGGTMSEWPCDLRVREWPNDQPLRAMGGA